MQVVAEHVGLEQAFARAHPVDVAAQRVDLAVVRDVAVRVRQRPGRERVGAEALVHERERRLDVGIGQIGKRRLDLVGRQHPLVDERARRQARDVEHVALGERQLVDRVLDALADHVELALEAQRIGLQRRLAGRVAAVADEQLLDDRHRGGGRRAQHVLRRRHRPPAEERLAFLADDLLDRARGAVSARRRCAAGRRCRRRTGRPAAGRCRAALAALRRNRSGG